MNNQFSILQEYDEISRYLSDVCGHADANRNALGFFPSSVYEEFAKKGDLFVLVDNTDSGTKCIGHLMFNARYPRAHIRQIYVDPDYRKNGLAKDLLDCLCVELTKLGYTSIYARVAQDLTSSNTFWERNLFTVQRIDEGGRVRQRKILVRCRELDSPQLFPASGLNMYDPLGLETHRTAFDIPVFLLDLNVLFDVSKARRPLHSNAISLFRAERMNNCKLGISDEIRRELERHTHEPRTDPMLTFVSVLQTYPLIDINNQTDIEELAELVFPNKKIGDLSENDMSDLLHLVTVIQYKLSGLITNDRGILKASGIINKKFGVDVLSPELFFLDDVFQTNNTSFEAPSDTELVLREVNKSDEVSIRSVLISLKLSLNEIANDWLSDFSTNRYVVEINAEIVGYLSRIVSTINGEVKVHVAVNEEIEDALSVARVLLLYLLENAEQSQPYKITLSFPSNQSSVRDIANQLGFRGIPAKQYLVKLVLGRVLTKSNWSDCQKLLKKSCKLCLPVSMPSWSESSQQLEVGTPNGNRAYTSLHELESLLSPSLFCLSGRSAVITPVRRNYANQLLGFSSQKSLIPSPSVSLFHERHYISDKRTLKHFTKGALILFYESSKEKGAKAIIALARVTQAYHQLTAGLENKALEASVLTSNSIDDIGNSDVKTVTVFDNIFGFSNPVPLDYLQEIGCGRPNDLISTKPITSTQLDLIVQKGF